MQYVKHVVGAPPHHHHHGHGGGFGFPYPVYDYPVYVACPPGWGMDQYGQCQPLEQHKVGQDMVMPRFARYTRVGQDTFATSYDPVTGQPLGADAPTNNAQAQGQGTANVPYPNPLAPVDNAAGKIGKGISDAAFWLGLFGLGVVGVIAYTAYKTDAPRHAAEYGRASLAHADESTRLAARLVAK